MSLLRYLLAVAASYAALWGAWEGFLAVVRSLGPC